MMTAVIRSVALGIHRPINWIILLTIAATALMISATPADYAMGAIQRILYVHVSVAWLSLLGFIAMALFAAIHLFGRNLKWDVWAQAANELGWLCCTLTLLTGSIWARAAWGTWWTWEPRLTTTFILWLLYSGSLLVRYQSDARDRRAIICSILAVLGALDVPLIIMATRLFRGVHPVSPEMDSAMRMTLMISMASFTAIFIVVLVARKSQLTVATSAVHQG